MRKTAVKQAIVELALEKFRKFGIRRVTMDEISRDLRMSKKTLYQHFPDKESLVKECAARVVKTIVPMVEGALDEDGPVTARVVKAWRAFAMLHQLVSGEYVADIKTGYPHIWAEIDRTRRGVIARFEKLFCEGIASGEIRPEIHPKVALKMLFAIMDNVMVPDILGAGEFTIREAVLTLTTILGRGMFVKPPDVDIFEALS